MSFSGKVREELSENISQARHCRIAELAAFIGMCGTVSIDSFDRYHIKIHSENIVVARKVFTLLKKTFNIRTDISVKRNVKRESVSYLVVIKSHEDALRVLQATKMIGEQQVVVKPLPTYLNDYGLKDAGIIGCTILGDGNISLILDIVNLYLAAIENA